MGYKTLLIFLLLINPSTSMARGEWQTAAYLSILIPVSFFPFIIGLQRIRFDAKKYNIKLAGAIFIYWLTSLLSFLLAITLFSSIGLVHYFMLVTLGPLVGFLIFQAWLKVHLDNNN